MLAAQSAARRRRRRSRPHGTAAMAKSKNHTNHNQNYKAHRNGIKKPARVRWISTKGVRSHRLPALLLPEPGRSSQRAKAQCPPARRSGTRAGRASPPDGAALPHQPAPLPADGPEVPAEPACCQEEAGGAPESGDAQQKIVRASPAGSPPPHSPRAVARTIGKVVDNLVSGADKVVIV